MNLTFEFALAVAGRERRTLSNDLRINAVNDGTHFPRMGVTKQIKIVDSVVLIDAVVIVLDVAAAVVVRRAENVGKVRFLY